jgi:hypothetical protein
MYFYKHKFFKYETQQNLLLEMRCDAFIHSGNDRRIYGLDINTN